LSLIALCSMVWHGHCCSVRIHCSPDVHCHTAEGTYTQCPSLVPSSAATGGQVYVFCIPYNILPRNDLPDGLKCATTHSASHDLSFYVRLSTAAARIPLTTISREIALQTHLHILVLIAAAWNVSVTQASGQPGKLPEMISASDFANLILRSACCRTVSHSHEPYFPHRYNTVRVFPTLPSSWTYFNRSIAVA
jgi:hypothetical protein